MDTGRTLKSIIFIRRDNIGDLVCTTPAIRAVRLKYPKARICVLVNSYNADAVRNNPDVDEIYVYEKEKHAGDKSRFKVLLSNFNLLRKVRKEKFDCTIGCSYAYSPRLARYTYLTGARTRIGYIRKGKSAGFFYNQPLNEPETPIHEVEAMMRLLGPLGIAAPPAPLSIWPLEDELKKARQYLKRMGAEGKMIVFHISSRRPRNRWPVERFKELGDRITAETGLKIMLLWSPGDPKNALHPGDDDKAEELLSTMNRRPLAYRTETLAELIAVMSLSGLVVCSDGGAMHIAAALGKPVLTIWGTTDRRRWAPWGVPHMILQKGGKAEAISAEEAFTAFKKMYSDLKDGKLRMPVKN